MADKDAFTLVNEASHPKIYDDYDTLSSGHLADPQTFLTAAFRREYPELAVTCTTARNPALLAFAAAGHATCELDTDDESINRVRGYTPGNARYGRIEGLYEIRLFAKYNYRWGDEFFILYVINMGAFGAFNFILKEPGANETTLSNTKVVDDLIMTCGRWQYPVDNDFIYVYDGYWRASKPLWEEVQKARWDDVILNEEMKKTLVDLMTKFFDSEDIYKDLGVPWKRGVIFHGPAGTFSSPFPQFFIKSNWKAQATAKPFPSKPSCIHFRPAPPQPPSRPYTSSPPRPSTPSAPSSCRPAPWPPACSSSRTLTPS